MHTDININFSGVHSNLTMGGWGVLKEKGKSDFPNFNFKGSDDTHLPHSTVDFIEILKQIYLHFGAVC